MKIVLNLVFLFFPCIHWKARLAMDSKKKNCLERFRFQAGVGQLTCSKNLLTWRCIRYATNLLVCGSSCYSAKLGGLYFEQIAVLLNKGFYKIVLHPPSCLCSYPDAIVSSGVIMPVLKDQRGNPGIRFAMVGSAFDAATHVHCG